MLQTRTMSTFLFCFVFFFFVFFLFVFSLFCFVYSFQSSWNERFANWQGVCQRQSWELSRKMCVDSALGKYQVPSSGLCLWMLIPLESPAGFRSKKTFRGKKIFRGKKTFRGKKIFPSSNAYMTNMTELVVLSLSEDTFWETFAFSS